MRFAQKTQEKRQRQAVRADIPYDELIEWLIAREKLCTGWQDGVQRLHNEMRHALTALVAKKNVSSPIKNHLLLEGKHPNHYDCMKVVQFLNGDQKLASSLDHQETLNIWSTILKDYEKDNLCLGDCARLLLQLLKYQCPSLENSINQNDREIQEQERKFQEYEREAEHAKKIFKNECTDIGIEGKELELELMNISDCQLPSLLAAVKIAADVKEVEDAMAYYADFVLVLTGEDTGKDKMGGTKGVAEHFPALNTLRSTKAAQQISEVDSLKEEEATALATSAGGMPCSQVVSGGNVLLLDEHFRQGLSDELSGLQTFLKHRKLELGASTENPGFLSQFQVAAAPLVRRQSAARAGSHLAAVEEVISRLSKPRLTRLLAWAPSANPLVDSAGGGGERREALTREVHRLAAARDRGPRLATAAATARQRIQEALYKKEAAASQLKAAREAAEKLQSHLEELLTDLFPGSEIHLIMESNGGSSSNSNSKRTFKNNDT